MTRRLSALEATLAVLFVLMTVVSVTLITLMATGKTHTGENTHTRTHTLYLTIHF